MNIALRGLKSILRTTRLLPRFYHLINQLHPSFEGLHPVNLRAITQALQKAPDGDYYEFGVYKGFSLWFATQIAAALQKSNMHFFGFDSFDGLPEPENIDRTRDSSGNTFARGNFCAGLTLAQGFIEKYGADMSKVRLIQGFFEDVLHSSLASQYQMRPAAVILIDCDMYKSTKTVLNFISNVIQPQTIILFDDWLLTDENHGQRLAFREWLSSNPEIRVADFCEFDGGKGFQVLSVSARNRQ